MTPPRTLPLVAKYAHIWNGANFTPDEFRARSAELDDHVRAAERQPNVRMLFLFHVVDETRLEGLQSGTRYADGTPKSSEAPVRAALESASTPGAVGTGNGG